MRFCCSVKPSQLWWGLLPISTINEIFRTIPLAFRRVSVCVCLVGFASLQSPWAHTLRHPCLFMNALLALRPLQSWSFAVGASLPRQPSVSLRPAATAICAVASCNGFVWLSLCILAYRLFATTCKHPCLNLWAFISGILALLAPPVATNTSIPTTVAKSQPPLAQHHVLASPRKRGGGTAVEVFRLAVQYSDSPAFTILKLFRAVTVGIAPHPHHQ